MSALRRSRPEGEGGFTLVELLISAGLLLLVLTTAGGMIISSARTQDTTTRLTQASNEAQLTSTNITGAIRNASGFAVSPLDGSGQLLRARVGSVSAGGATTWRCHAWYYSVPAKAIYWRTSDTGAIPAPDSSFTGWSQLVRGVEASTAPFAPTGSSSAKLSLNFTVQSGSSGRIPINTAASPQAGATTGTPTCF